MISATVFALASSLGFKSQDLIQRRLQEHGMSSISTFALHKYALLPAIIWSFFFVEYHQITVLFHTPKMLFYFLFLAITWNAQGLLAALLLNSTSSMSVISVIEKLIYFPLLLLVGTFLNHDTPSIASFMAIGSLCLALLIQPSQHEENTRSRYTMPLLFIIGLAFLRGVLDALNNGLSREVLQTFPAASFLGVFAVMTLSMTAIGLLFVACPKNDAAIFKKWYWLALLMPVIWFIASIPETWGYAKLPIYTMVSIGALTFLLDLSSDFKHRRIRIGMRTVSFIVFTLIGMGLAMYSV